MILMLSIIYHIILLSSTNNHHLFAWALVVFLAVCNWGLTLNIKNLIELSNLYILNRGIDVEV